MNGINTIEKPTINGLKSLALDELSTSQLNTNDLNANNIYLENKETNDITIDNEIIMNNGSVILSNGTTITDLEISYLDNVNNNIQFQINNVNTDIDNIETNVTNIETDLNNLDVRVDTLEDITQHLSSDTTTTYNLSNKFFSYNIEVGLTGGISFYPDMYSPEIFETQYFAFTNARKDKLENTTLINSSNKLNCELIGTGIVDNTEFNYLNGVTSNIQTQNDNLQIQIDDLETQVDDLQTQIDDIPINSSTLVNCIPAHTNEFIGTYLNSVGTWYDSNHTWTPGSSSSYLDVGIYMINLMVTAGEMTELIKLRSKIIVRNSSGTIDESYLSGILLQSQTSNEPYYHWNQTFFYNSTVASTNWVTVFTEFHLKAGSGCYCVGRLQICKIN